jgi:hypothetical protein
MSAAPQRLGSSTARGMLAESRAAANAVNRAAANAVSSMTAGAVERVPVNPCFYANRRLINSKLPVLRISIGG